MIYEPPYLVRARADARLGIMEKRGEIHHPRILEYHIHTTLEATTDEVPWCASAVSCWLEESGIRSTRSARARSYLNWGTHLATPLFGAICVLKRGGSNQPGPEVLEAQGHVGIFLDLPTPWDVLVLGGNQSDKVCERYYPVERVLGYRAAA